jgi:hypothetical protein
VSIINVSASNLLVPSQAIGGTQWVLSVTSMFAPFQTICGETIEVLECYGTLPSANLYFDNRLRSRPWKRATNDEKMAALREATEQIDALNFSGRKISEEQNHAFPRMQDECEPGFGYPYSMLEFAESYPREHRGKLDTRIPWNVIRATYEIALKLLDGFDPELDIKNLNTISDGFSSARSSYDRSFVLEHIRAGIPSAKAWDLLRPYLADSKHLKMIRDS